MIVRPARLADVPGLTALLSAIVARGGTTAIERPLDPATFRDWFLDGPRALACLVAEVAAVPVAFQAVGSHPDLPDGWGDIATFAARPRTGAGTALFEATRAEARRLGLATLNATIRADNAGGLAYYRRMGFRPWKMDPAVPLVDGTPVDRISTRHDL